MDKLREIANAPSGDAPRLATCKAKFKKILIGVDFSGPMATALNAAKSLAGEFGGTLFLVHAAPPVLYDPEQPQNCWRRIWTPLGRRWKSSFPR